LTNQPQQGSNEASKTRSPSAPKPAPPAEPGRWQAGLIEPQSAKQVTRPFWADEEARQFAGFFIDQICPGRIPNQQIRQKAKKKQPFNAKTFLNTVDGGGPPDRFAWRQSPQWWTRPCDSPKPPS
jgi:hypothetical protein